MIGAMATLVPLFNSDIKAFIGTRVGFAFLSILTALAASNDITPVSASGMQLTVVDTLSAYTILFGMCRTFSFASWCCVRECVLLCIMRFACASYPLGHTNTYFFGMRILSTWVDTYGLDMCI